MTNDFTLARRKLVTLYLLIIAGIILVFSLLIIYQVNDSFQDPAIKTNKEIKITAAEAEAIAKDLLPGKEIEETEYEIERGVLYYTVSFGEESEVKVDLLTAETYIPEDDGSLLSMLTDDFEDMLGWIALFVFLLSALLSVYVANNTLHPIATSIRKQKQFVSDAAHEFRNPLTALHARIESVMRMGTQGFNKEVLQDLFGETKRLIRLSESLLAFEKGEYEKKKCEELPLKGVSDSVIHRLEHLLAEKKITIVTDIDSKMLKIHKADLEAILYNLLHNAIKFTPDNGTITLRWFKGTLTVADTGIGISQRDRAYMFDRFYKADKSRTEEGNGLGLSLVKEIVDRYEAKIDVETTVGKGTTIIIRFR